MSWILFIYTLPSQPTRKRAYIWRELKRLGALYLRDGVALLPRRTDLEERMQTMAMRVQEYEGTVELVLAPQFPEGRDAHLVERFRHERAEEYRELYRACVRFLRDVLDEVDADDFGFPDVNNLEGELARLRRWQQQIQERDYFAAPGSDRVEEILGKCERAFEHFTSSAHERQDGGTAVARDDVFERLVGPEKTADPVPDDYPL